MSYCLLIPVLHTGNLMKLMDSDVVNTETKGVRLSSYSPKAIQVFLVRVLCACVDDTLHAGRNQGREEVFLLLLRAVPRRNAPSCHQMECGQRIPSKVDMGHLHSIVQHQYEFVLPFKVMQLFLFIKL